MAGFLSLVDGTIIRHRFIANQARIAIISVHTGVERMMSRNLSPSWHTISSIMAQISMGQHPHRLQPSSFIMVHSL